MLFAGSAASFSVNLLCLEVPPAASESDDPDVDGLANKIPVRLIDPMEFYLLNYFKHGI